MRKNSGGFLDGCHFITIYSPRAVKYRAKPWLSYMKRTKEEIKDLGMFSAPLKGYVPFELNAEAQLECPDFLEKAFAAYQREPDDKDAPVAFYKFGEGVRYSRISSQQTLKGQPVVLIKEVGKPNYSAYLWSKEERRREGGAKSSFDKEVEASVESVAPTAR